MNARFATVVLAAFLGIASVGATGCSSDVPTTGDEQDVTANAGRFETFKGGDGQYYFHLIAGNYEKVLHSEGYSSKSAAQKGVSSVKKNGATSASYEILKASNGEHYFNLVAGNGEIVGTSELYGTKSAATKGAESVRKLIVKQLRVEAAETGGAELEVFDGRDGDVHFHLRAANGEIVMMSEGYEDEDGAKGRKRLKCGAGEKDDGAFGCAERSKEGGVSGCVATTVGWVWRLRWNAPSK